MRHKYNKRKEAFVKSKKPPKRRMKEDLNSFNSDGNLRMKKVSNVHEQNTLDRHRGLSQGKRAVKSAQSRS